MFINQACRNIKPKYIEFYGCLTTTICLELWGANKVYYK